MRLKNLHPRARPDLARIRRAISRIGPLAGPGGRGTDIILTDDRHIAMLARRFRGERGPTDVLAFEYGDDPLLAGEVAVSIDTARRQSRQRGLALEDELILLCVHGILHVGGQRDETRRDRLVMRRKEFETLARIL